MWILIFPCISETSICSPRTSGTTQYLDILKEVRACANLSFEGWEASELNQHDWDITVAEDPFIIPEGFFILFLLLCTLLQPFILLTGCIYLKCKKRVG